MHQSSVNLAAGLREIAYGEGVSGVGCDGFVLGHVHLVVSRGIEDDSGIHFGERALHARSIANVDGGTVKAGYLIAALRKLPDQLNPELSTTSKDHNIVSV